MKILLASLSIEDQSRFDPRPDYAYPLGIAYLHSVLEQDGNEVKTLFMNNYSYERTYERFFSTVREWNPDVVGLQVFTMNRVATYKILDVLLLKYPHIRVVLGGIHASIMYHQLLNKYPTVIVVIGEGEITLKQLINSYKSGSSLNSIEGLAFWRDGQVIMTNPRPLIQDLDLLPFPKHQIFFENEPKRKVAHMITSRGCPFKCSFCCLHIISERKWRTRDPEKVVEELILLKETYPSLHTVQFHDDTLTLDQKRTFNLCELLIKQKLGLKFICSARVKPSSREMFLLMKKAGFTKIMFGLETGSRTLLKSIHKNIKPEDAINLFENIRGIDFDITTFLMCGFPGENDETISETIKLVKKTQKIHYNYIAGVGKLIVYPGTEVYEIMKKAGNIDDNFWLSYEPVPLFTVENSLARLLTFENRIMNNVSIDRILTKEGFKSQIPYLWKEILIFIFKNPMQIAYIIQSILPVFIIRKLKALRKLII